MFKKILSAVFFISLTFTGYALGASWIDDWLSQTSNAGPSYFSGQQRGYYSGGSFSARFQTSRSYPVSVSAPSIKAGCGGIDIFMGGFSFIKDPDLIVKKLESALSSAAAIAFDMALDTLCQPCTNALRNFEKVSDMLNSLNFDDCQAGKAIATVAMSPFSGAAAESMRTETQNFLASSGVDSFYKATQEFSSNPKDNVKNALSSAAGGSGTDAYNLLSAGSLLEKIASKRSVPADYMDLARGFIGDIIGNETNDGLKFSKMSPCDDNKGGLEAISLGKAKKKSASGSCSDAASAGNDLRTKTAAQINNIVNAVKSKTGTIGTEETQLIQRIPGSLYLTIKHGVALGVVEADSPALTDYATEIVAFKMLDDLLAEAHKGVLYYYEVASGMKDGTFQGMAVSELEEMEKRIRTLSRENFEIITAKTQQFQNFMLSAAQKDRIYREMIYESLGRKVL